MNYLAHAYLAGEADSDRIGGILGDFIKGTLPGVLPPPLAAGVALHRSIDSFADNHPAFQRSRRRVSTERRRYAGVMVDMFYDHLLAANWHHFNPQPLPKYTNDLYALLHAHVSILPERLAGILPYMRQDDWLTSYAAIDGVGGALDRIARHRLKQPGTLPGAVVELQADYAGFTEDFFEFMESAAAYAALRRDELSQIYK
ncbi:MAG TPA: ACP phosphodiesterase [Rhodocyclaceae bacterium]|nr:ACP phosphodiesterase [Rhodocyclaceae bacterium]